MAKLSSVKAFIPSAKTFSEINLSESDGIDEHGFRLALDKLAGIFTDENLSNNDKLHKMLDTGLEFLQMPSAILGSVTGNSMELICTAGAKVDGSPTGNMFSVNDKICSIVFESDETVAIHNISQSDYANNNATTSAELKSYIGTQVSTTNGPLGTVCFFAPTVRETPFNEYEIRIIETIANWAGLIIGVEENIEFLTHQNEYYQSLFKTVPSMIMLCNQDGLILSTSDRLCTEIGITPTNLPGQSCQGFFDKSDHSILTNALIDGDFEHLPLTLSRTNGEHLEVELSSSIKTIGSMQGVRMIVLSDVSERNRAMKSVEKQNKQLALVNQSLNQFAAIASHDLQEPLRKIQQFTHFLEEDLAETITSDGRYHLDVIANSATRMSTLIKDLLEFSSATQDKLVVTDVDLPSLLKEVCVELELRIEETNAQIVIADLPTVKCDRSLTRQLFTNLVGNSLKYRDEHRDPIVEIRSGRTDENLTVTISDNGIGFDQKHVSKAFKPFNRLHSSKEYKGNGIGLSICTTVCEKHGWKLSATSKPGKGSVFTISMEN